MHVGYTIYIYYVVAGVFILTVLDVCRIVGLLESSFASIAAIAYLKTYNSNLKAFRREEQMGLGRLLDERPTLSVSQQSLPRAMYLVDGLLVWILTQPPPPPPSSPPLSLSSPLSRHHPPFPLSFLLLFRPVPLSLLPLSLLPLPLPDPLPLSILTVCHYPPLSICFYS